MDILKYVEVGYRALEHREEIEYLAGRVQPYVDMIKADAPDLFPQAAKLFGELFPADPNAPKPTYDVKWVQRRLNAMAVEMSPLAVDGDYGEKTYEAVKSFQIQHGLVADGWLGPKTMAVLHALSGA